MHCSFDATKNDHNYYSGKDCMKNFCKDLKTHPTKIINYELVPLTNEEKKSYRKQKTCLICKKEFSTDDNDEKYYKVPDHCHQTGKYRDTVHIVCNLRYEAPEKVPVVYQNGSKYDYHIISKELAEEFKGQFQCQGENTENYITNSATIEKGLKNNDNHTQNKVYQQHKTYVKHLSSLVDNLSERLHNDHGTS